MNHIKYMGIELEGAWNNLNYEQSQLFKHDGSVSVDQKFYNCECKKCNCSKCKHKNRCCKKDEYTYVGEIASKPLELKPLLEFIKNNYPDKCNRTTGAHCHFSFKNISDYGRLLDRKFYYGLLDELERFGRINNLNKKGVFWTRIKGKNEYCKRSFIPEQQIRGEASERYTILNACYQKHGTLEIRVLPCFQQKELTIKAVHFLHDFIEDYLSNKAEDESLNMKIKIKDVPRIALESKKAVK